MDDPVEARRILAVLEAQQRARIEELGLPYTLDDKAFAQHYRALTERFIGKGSALLTVLSSEETIVAALLGIRHGSHYAMVRLSTAGEAWKACSPGRLLIERTMAYLHGQGCRTFDFTIGEYAYKRRMGVASLPLCEVSRPLSWKGLPAHAGAAARRQAKRSHRLVALVRRLKARAG